MVRLFKGNLINFHIPAVADPGWLKGRQLPTPNSNLLFCKCLPKTAWKWKNLDSLVSANFQVPFFFQIISTYSPMVLLSVNLILTRRLFVEDQLPARQQPQRWDRLSLYSEVQVNKFEHVLGLPYDLSQTNFIMGSGHMGPPMNRFTHTP